MHVMSDDAKVVWIINQYASTPETGIGGRHYSFAKLLADKGVKVCLVMASFHHLLRNPVSVSSKYTVQKNGNLTLVWVRVPEYKGAHQGKRILNWFLFAYRLLGLKRVLEDTPKTILYSSLSPIGILAAERLAKLFRSRLIFEVRDIWPLTLTEIGGVSKFHPFVKFLQWVEDHGYKVADSVVSNLPGAVDHMVVRGMDSAKFVWIPNGIFLDEVSKSAPLNEEARSRLPKDCFIIGYAGTVGVANALDCLVSAAKRVLNQPDIRFVIVGDGLEKERLCNRVADEGINNILFLPAVPKSQVQSVLGEFDVCFIGWKDESLYRFGVGANKLPEYFFSGKPVLQAYSGRHDLVSEFKAGVTVPAEDPAALAREIVRLKSLTIKERAAIGNLGRQAALEHFDYNQLSDRLKRVLFPEEAHISVSGRRI